jgi:formate hydrogenlyase subunit 4
MARSMGIVSALVQMAIVVLLGPLVTGCIQKLKARLQSRRGASVVQPYRDLAKLLRKGTVQSDTGTAFYRAIPPLVLAAMMSAAAMVPILALPAAGWAPLGDAIFLVGLLALARFLTAIGALDAGGAFGGMGASREMTLGPLVEPVLLLVVFSVAAAFGTTDLGEVAARRAAQGALSWRAPDVLALGAALVLLLAETGRIPVDNPDTHLELTMIHEGMLLEHSGPGLACMALATHTKQLVMIAVIGALFFPLGLAKSLEPLSVVIALVAFLGKAVVLGLYLGLVESSYAKLRFFRVPQFLGIGFVCAFLGLALRFL